MRPKLDVAVSPQPSAGNDGLRAAALAIGILLLILGGLGLLYILLVASSIGSMMSGMGGMMGGGAATAMIGAAVGPWVIASILVIAGGVVLTALGRR